MNITYRRQWDPDPLCAIIHAFYVLVGKLPKLKGVCNSFMHALFLLEQTQVDGESDVGTDDGCVARRY